MRRKYDVPYEESYNTRLSINFVAWLGNRLPVSLRGLDDEYESTVEVPNKLGLSNATYLPFIVSHLTFSPHQEQSMRHELPVLLDRYRKLCSEVCVADN